MPNIGTIASVVTFDYSLSFFFYFDYVYNYVNENPHQSINSHKNWTKISNYYVITYQADFCVKQNIIYPV